MRIHFIQFAASFLTLAVFFIPAHGQKDMSAEKSSHSSAVPVHDLEGVWNGRLGTVGGTNLNKDTAPMLPWARAKFDYNTVELLSLIHI